MKSNKLITKPPNIELRVATRPSGDNSYLMEISNANVRHAIIILGKLIAKLVPFDKIDDAVLALCHEVELNLRLVNKETAKFFKAETILHLVNEMRTGRFTIGIQDDPGIVQLKTSPFLFNESIVNQLSARF